MSFRPRSRSTRSSGTSRNKHYSWESGLFAFDNLSAGTPFAAGYVVLPSELENEFQDPTLFATRMVAAVRTAGAATLAAAAVGLIAWDDIDDTVPGAGQAPGPITHSDRDWIIRQVFAFPTGTTTGTVATSLDGLSYMSKARRRLGRSRGLLLCAESQGVVANYVIDVRCLLRQV